MRPAKEPARPKPVWEVHARPINAAHEPWRVLRVEARSAIQAQAIMRRRGYEMAVETAMRVSGVSDFVGPAQIRPLACARCGYALSGLTIDRATVTCPECSYPQALVVWDPENHGQPRGAHWIVYVLAAIGGIVALLFMLLIATAMLL